jgi:hypothetical protein
VKKLNFSPASSGVKTGVQSIRKALKSRSERDWIPAFAGMKKSQINIFTPSPIKRGRISFFILYIYPLPGRERVG